MTIIILNPLGDRQWATGGEKRIREIQEYLKKKVKDTKIITYEDLPVKVDAAHFFQANVCFFKKIQRYSSGHKTIFLFPAICSLFTFLTTALLRIFCRTKIVITAEHFKNPFSPTFKSALVQGIYFVANVVCLHSAHLIIVVSESTRRECRKMWTRNRRIRTVANGIDKVFNIVKHDKLKKEDGTVNILCVGYCARIKGVCYLTEAMKFLSEQGQKKYSLESLEDY